MLNKIDSEAWSLIATSFDDLVADDDDEAVAENATTVARTKFSERLLRNILDLDAGRLPRNRPRKRWAGIIGLT